MSENKHTPEPWVIDRDNRPGMAWNNHIVSVSDPNQTICFMTHDNSPENEKGEENARRLVACVNACAGSPTDALEEMQRRSLTFGQLAFLHAELTKQRDELLSALEAAYNGLQWYQDAYPEAVSEADGEEMARIDTTIASMKGINPVIRKSRTTETSAPAIIFYPAGSLGEEVQP